MFHRSGDYVTAIGIGFRRSPDRRVVALRRAGCEQDLFWVGYTQMSGDFLSRFVDRLRRALRGIVHRAGIEVIFGEKGNHRLVYFGRDSSRGVVVRVYYFHASTAGFKFE